jgi:hypothetical protein
MIYVYLYKFRGIEATLTVEAENIPEADERIKAIGTAQYEGELIEEIAISDAELARFADRVVH